MEIPEGTVLAEGTKLSGRIVGRDAEIRGEFEGEVALEGRLVVGRGGVVKASVKARSVVVQGSFSGQIHAERLAFSETARAEGAFWAEEIRVSEGAVLDGPVNLPPAETATATVVPDETEIADSDLGQEAFAAPC